MSRKYPRSVQEFIQILSCQIGLNTQNIRSRLAVQQQQQQLSKSRTCTCWCCPINNDRRYDYRHCPHNVHNCRASVRPSVCLSVPFARCGFAAVGPSARRYRSIAQQRDERRANAALSSYLVVKQLTIDISRPTGPQQQTRSRRTEQTDRRTDGCTDPARTSYRLVFVETWS